jgi:hypothetical protein
MSREETGPRSKTVVFSPNGKLTHDSFMRELAQRPKPNFRNQISYQWPTYMTSKFS